MLLEWDFRPSRIVLGLASIVAPLLFALIGLSYASSLMLGSEIQKIILPVEILKPKSAPAPKAAPPAPTNASNDADKDKTKSAGGAKADKQDDPALRPLVRQITARQSYAVMTSFHFAACAFAAGLAIAVLAAIYRRRWIALLLVVSGILSLIVAAYDGKNDNLRERWVDKILERADAQPSYGAPDPAGACDPKPCLTLQGGDLFKGGLDSVKLLVRINTVVGLTAVWMILFALCATTLSKAPKPAGVADDASKPWLAPVNQREQGWRLRVLLYGAAAVLATSVLTSKTLLDWPSTLLEPLSQNSLKLLTDSLLGVWATAYSLVLLTAFGPAFAAWLLDREEYRALPKADRDKLAVATGGADDKELDILPASLITSILSLLAPVLAPSILEFAKVLLSLGGGK
ncbi:hypothetical protein [Terrarubrum flagellatum]|uniref:hypothetical protein n=1 Tax=Terrirubrum flagellatum TaxID=2895980 RepID=UPI0031455226